MKTKLGNLQPIFVEYHTSTPTMSLHSITVSIDVGDRHSHLCLLGTETGEVIEESKIRTNLEAFKRYFSKVERMRVTIGAGNHFLWTSRLLKCLGPEVLVANTRKLRLICDEGQENDKLDAENVAHLVWLDPKLLSPLRHRSEASQAYLALVRSRDALIRSGTQLVNHVIGVQ